MAVSRLPFPFRDAPELRHDPGGGRCRRGAPIGPHRGSFAPRTAWAPNCWVQPGRRRGCLPGGSPPRGDRRPAASATPRIFQPLVWFLRPSRWESAIASAPATAPSTDASAVVRAPRLDPPPDAAEAIPASPSSSPPSPTTAATPTCDSPSSPSAPPSPTAASRSSTPPWSPLGTPPSPRDDKT